MKVKAPFRIEITRKRPNIRQTHEHVVAAVYALQGTTYNYLHYLIFRFLW